MYILKEKGIGFIKKKNKIKIKIKIKKF